MSKDNRKIESERALERAKCLKAQPTDESYYERLLRQREFATSMYEHHLFSGELIAGRPYRREVNHLSHLIENYEKLNGKSGSGSIEITWNMPDIGKWDEEQEKKHVNRPE